MHINYVGRLALHFCDEIKRIKVKKKIISTKFVLNKSLIKVSEWYVCNGTDAGQDQ